MDRIQEGIHFRKGEQPATHFAVVFLDVVNTPIPQELGNELGKIWDVLQKLKKGYEPDLPGQQFDPKDLTVLIGFGSSLFDLHAFNSRKPPELKNFRAPFPDGGGPVTRGSGISYSNHVTTNKGAAAVVLQFTASSALAVRRAVVETWKVVDRHKRDLGSSNLRVAESFTGFGREDKRSWIGFFDGTSNLRSDRRLEAIEIKERAVELPDGWKEGGTYMCFMRICVSLGPWQKLSLSEQEILVGRDKMSGCPLSSNSDGSNLRPVKGCPFSSGGNVEDGKNERFRVASRPAPSNELRHSHIHRANLRPNPNPGDPESRLIYRQGYEFFDDFDELGEPLLGLNFVSFQDTPERILGMLKQPGWLGKVNFGGDPDNQPEGMANLLQVQSAGFFVIPPRNNDDTLPGSILFNTIL